MSLSTMSHELSECTIKRKDIFMPTIPEIIDNIPDTRQDPPGWFEWYYRLFAPPAASLDASLKEREVARRGRLASIIMVLSLLLILPALAASFHPGSNNNPFVIPILLFAMALQISGIIFNKLGYITIAGALCVITTEIGNATAITTNPAGMTVWTLGMFSLMVQPELFAASLLPPRSIFMVALANICFFIFFFFGTPHAPDLVEQIRLQGDFALLLQPCILQAVIAVVAYVWVQSANQAIRKADRATEVARLQQELLKQQHVNEQHQQELDYAISLIEHVHQRVANGDLSARVPLTENNALLLSIGGKFNILLQRYQRRMHSEAQISRVMQNMIYGIQENTAVVEHSRHQEKPQVELRRTATPLDGLLQAFVYLLNHLASSQRTTTKREIAILVDPTQPPSQLPSSSTDECCSSGGTVWEASQKSVKQ